MEKFLKISNPTAPGGFNFVNIGKLMDCRMVGPTGLLMKYVNKSGSTAIYFSGRTAGVTGTNTTFAPSPNTSNLLIDSSATFITDGVKKGDVVTNLGGITTVVSVDSETQITLADYVIQDYARDYYIWSDYSAPARFMQNAIVEALQSKWTEPFYEVNNFPFTITP
jgi:hypothetical protein